MAGRTIVIVGGVAGGASAAARLRRLDEAAEIILFERGPYVSFANCGLPYHLSGEIEDREDLVLQTPASLHQRFKLDVRVRHEVLSIDSAEHSLKVKDLTTGQIFDQPYDKLVLSPGAAPVIPAIPGIALPGVHVLRTLGDMDAIKARLDGKPKGRALIVGAGFIGLEMAEALRHRDWQVSAVELSAQVLPPADPEMAVWVARELKAQGVALHLNQSLTGLRPGKDGALVAELGSSLLEADLVLLAVGVRPESGLASKAGLALGKRGGIQVDEHLRTSDPDIYAVGDAIEVRNPVTGSQGLVPLAGPANRQGRIVADNLVGIASTYKGTLGTAIVKVFGLAFAMTGASAKALTAAGRSFETVHLHPGNHAAYYPGASSLHLKLLYDPGNGKILGAQAVGGEGVDKRIDVLATAISAGLTVEDLAELELAYAPPFGSAKDPVNMAGFIASNARSGLGPLASMQQAQHPTAEQVLLDVRTASEFAQGSIPGAINIPVDSLRQRLAEVDSSKEQLVFCKVGQRAHVAARILAGAGIQQRNISGGWLTWQAFREAQAA